MKESYTYIYWIHAVSPIHIGSGESENAIDLPIIREKVTNYPFIPGSSIKGVLRDYCVDQRVDEGHIKVAFGNKPDAITDDIQAGAFVFTDARLVCFPVRSFYGTFAWLTSPYILKRLRRDLNIHNQTNILPDVILEEDGSLLHSAGVPSVLSGPDNCAFLEDLDFKIQQNDAVAVWGNHLKQALFSGENAWQEVFSKRFGVVTDTVFDFVCETGTEVNAHIQIEGETKVVKQGALWYEEALPTETVLCGIISVDTARLPKSKTASDLVNNIFPKKLFPLQIGGKETTGKGLVRFSLIVAE